MVSDQDFATDSDSASRRHGRATRRAFCLAACLLIGGSLACFSQGTPPAAQASDTRPAFEVASAKPTPKGFTGRSIRKCENGRLTMQKAGLIGIVAWAFDVSRTDIIVPSWAQEAPGMPTYDIEAKASGQAPEAQMKLMLQRLLAERFQFAGHHEMRESVHRILRVAKGGPKLKEAGPVAADTRKVRPDSAHSQIICTGASIADFLFYLNVTGVGGTIYDRTGLSGRYDFTLDYGKYLQDSDGDHSTSPLVAARIEAMHELGLEVVDAKIAVDTFVVDHFEKVPTEN